MNDYLRSKLEHLLQGITSNCPQIATYVNGNLEPFSLGNSVTGFCSEPGLVDEQWMSPTGYRQFALADQPDGFTCLGLQNRDGVEYLYMMWVKNSRKFWFFDRIDDSPSIERISNRLNLALERWGTFHSDVLYSGITDNFFLIGFSPG
jgi:hypothetical protein